jgi:hypothetical protein
MDNLFLCYNLQNNIDGNRMVKDIQNLINQFRTNSQTQNGLLYITVKSITSDDTSLIPKLEYKGDCLT